MKTKTLLNTILLAGAAGVFTAEADIVTDWNTAILNSIRAGRTPPPMASRNMAILHASIYDAVNGVSQDGKHYLVKPLKKKDAEETSLEAAATTAAHTVMNALYPAYATAHATLHSNLLAGIPDGLEKNNGIAWGEQVATAMLASRANDGSTNVVAPPVSTGPGDWVPTPPAMAPYLLPQWGFVKPFTMKSSSQFRPSPPPPLTSLGYFSDYYVVRELGSLTSAARTPDPTEIAFFWANGPGTETPPGHWNDIAQDIAAAQDNTLVENARLFALLNLAMADAAICAWDAKYTYNWWRPITAIRAGDTDGNDGTVGDPGWTPLLATPPFPEHTSGHSTFSGAGAMVLALFYGTDNIPFTTGSDGLPGVTRSYASFSAAANESGLSRIYGGIHFMSAHIGGLSAGEAIGEQAFARFLRAKPVHPKPPKHGHQPHHPKPGHIMAQPE
jgi:membrane-associated phospholipid phosphatase